MKTLTKISLVVVAFLLTHIVAQAYPFIPTTDPNGKDVHWYQLLCQDRYLYGALDDHTKISFAGSNDESYQWCFVTDPESGRLRVYNRAIKKYMYYGNHLGLEANNWNYCAEGENDEYFYLIIFLYDTRYFVTFDNSGECGWAGYGMNKYTVVDVTGVEPEPDPNPALDVTLTPYAYDIPHNALDNNGNEGYQKLFDKNKATKVCVVDNTGSWHPIWIDFKSDRPITPTGYILTTAGDTRRFPTRNPKAWTIYAKAKEGDNWTTLAKVTDGAAAGLGTDDITDYTFPFVNNTTEYQFFRFEVSAIGGADKWDSSNYTFQLAEFQFMGKSSSIKGDVNGDGMVDVDDLNIVINVIIKKADESQWPKADVDGSGLVDIDDLNLIINIMVGKA